MGELVVKHAAGFCPVMIESGLLKLASFAKRYSGTKALIVTDDNVAPLWLPTLLDAFPGADSIVLPAGEQYKTLSTVTGIWNRMAELACGRDVLLVALGGGVVGDMTGFAAACWMRGVRYVQVPTTLLAQVDASVGGKTAVDHPAGKNLVGAFHQPDAVFIDPETLATLPAREFAAGIAEIVKIALICDRDFYNWIERNTEFLARRETDVVAHAIERSVQLKAEIVQADEKERGQRALLNLGHTFGHAIERATHFQQVLHGEAVAIGLILATRLSVQCCGLEPDFPDRLESLLRAFGLPTRLPEGIESDDLLKAMALDKKHMEGVWRFVVLAAPGQAKVHRFTEANAIRDVLESARTG